MSWAVALSPAVAGSAPEAPSYALTGAITGTFENTAFIFIAVLTIAGLV